MITYLAMISGRPLSMTVFGDLSRFSDVIVRRAGDEIRGRVDSKKCENDFLQIGHSNLDALLDLLDIIVSNDDGKITDIVIHIVNIYTSQCNLEVSRERLRRIANLGAALTISCDEE